MMEVPCLENPFKKAPLFFCFKPLLTMTSLSCLVPLHSEIIRPSPKTMPWDSVTWTMPAHSLVFFFCNSLHSSGRVQPEQVLLLGKACGIVQEWACHRRRRPGSPGPAGASSLRSRRRLTRSESAEGSSSSEIDWTDRLHRGPAGSCPKFWGKRLSAAKSTSALLGGFPAPPSPDDDPRPAGDHPVSRRQSVYGQVVVCMRNSWSICNIPSACLSVELRDTGVVKPHPVPGPAARGPGTLYHSSSDVNLSSGPPGEGVRRSCAVTVRTFPADQFWIRAGEASPKSRLKQKAKVQLGQGQVVLKPRPLRRNHSSVTLMDRPSPIRATPSDRWSRVQAYVVGDRPVVTEQPIRLHSTYTMIVVDGS